jgi:hypothetical protein
MWLVETNFVVRLGGNTYINTPNLVVFKGTPIFHLRRGDDGLLGIDFDVFGKDGARVARFRKGVVVDGDSGSYDITTGHDAFSVAEKTTGKMIARVQRRGVSGAELDVWVSTYLPNGALFDAGPTETNLGGIKMTGNTFKDCAAGIAIE